MKHTTLLLFLSFFIFLGCGKKQPETLVTDGYDEAAMDAAILRAQSEVDHFIEVLQSNGAESYSVKVPITDGDNTEHFWMDNIRYANGTFTGIISNEPGIVENVEFGQQWKVNKSDISDWMYVKGERIYGGYTIDPLLVTMPEAEANFYRAVLVR